MELISLQGLNCFQSSVISIAHNYKIDYPYCFSTLWSEVDFIYKEEFQLYVTKRLMNHLEQMGLYLSLVTVDTPRQIRKWLDQLANESLMVIEMDAFHIPWSPIYQLSSEVHYFCIKKEGDNQFLCFDPSYAEAGITFSPELLATQLQRLYLAEYQARPLVPFCEAEEAMRVLQQHPQTQKKIWAQMQQRVTAPELLRLAKYIDAMINNRYLYRYYLSYSKTSEVIPEVFGDDYFQRWKSIKNGFYKASFIENREKIFLQIKEQLGSVMEQEQILAEQIIRQAGKEK